MRNLIYPASFLLLGGYLLLADIPEFLQETADMTPFFLTSDFAAETIGKPGGWLAYTASFLSSCFALPWLGALLLLALTASYAYAQKAAFRIPAAVMGLCWIPALALLLNYSRLGYMLYVLKSPGLAFSMPLGMLFAAGLIGIYLRLRSIWSKAAWMIIVSMLLFYAVGAYALLASLAAFIYELFLFTKNRWRTSLPVLLALPLSALLLPLALYECGWLRRSLSTLYSLGLPDYLWTETERPLWYPFLLSAFFLLAFSAFAAYRRRKGSATRPARNGQVSSGRMRPHAIGACVLLLYVLSGYQVYAHTFRDDNYRCILRMKHAVEENDWQTVLQSARDCDSIPTRLQVLYTRLALQKTQSGGDALFTYPDGDTPYRTLRKHQYLRLVGGRSLYYYYGKVNYAYRWCMEDLVEYGRRPDYLRYMAKCALVNGETALARKYLDLLRTVPFQSDFVSRYEGYLSHPARIEADEEMAAVARLMNYEDMLDGDGGLIEVYLLNSFALMEGGTREMVDLSLQCCLIQKDISGFWPRFFRLLPTYEGGKIPLHYQEAALLFATLQQNIDPETLPIEPQVRERFARLVQASNANAQMGDEYNRTALYPDFGDTYWYYYFFRTGLKTT